MPGDQQPEPVVKPGEEFVHAERADARRRQLQRQRNPVEPPAQPRDGLSVVLVEAETRRGRAGAQGEQLYGAGLRQRRDRPDDLAGQHEGFPAGHQDAQPGSGLEQLGGQLGGLVDQVLAVVQDQQHPAGAQRVGQQVGRVHGAVVPDAQDGHDGVGGRAGAGERGPGQLDQPDTISEGVHCLGRRLQGQPRLADAARPREGHQPTFVQQRAQVGHCRRPADHVGEHGRQVRPGTGRQGGRSLHALKARGLLENVLIEGGQAGPGIQAKVVGQPAAQLAVAGHRLGLPAGPVQGEHVRGP